MIANPSRPIPLEALLPRAWRWPYAGVWIAVAASLSIAALQDYRRGGGTRLWEPLLWEYSSVLVIGVLALGVHALTRALRGRTVPAQSLGLALGLLAFIVLHVLCMFGIRFSIYAVAGVPYEPGPWSHIWVYEAGKDAVTYSMFVLISRGLWAAQDRAVLARELVEARHARLLDQVQPHFLFNTLNLISSTMHEDVARADRLLCELAELLRQTLAAQQRGEQALGEELALVEPFLALMQARFGPERLEVRIEADATARAVMLPALLLLNPVENAVKHGVARQPGRVRVEVSARVEARRLIVEVSNHGDAPAGNATTVLGEGSGLANLRERLRARYGAAAQMHFEASALGARLRLELPA